MNSKHDYAFKSIIVGEPGVGKTKLLRTYLKNAQIIDASGELMRYEDDMLDVGEVYTRVRLRDADVKLTIYDTMDMVLSALQYLTIDTWHAISTSNIVPSPGKPFLEPLLISRINQVWNDSGAFQGRFIAGQTDVYYVMMYADITMGCMQNCVVKLVGLVHAKLQYDVPFKNSFRSPTSVARHFAQHNRIECTEVYLGDSNQVVQCFDRLAASIMTRVSGQRSPATIKDSVNLERAYPNNDGLTNNDSRRCSC